MLNRLKLQLIRRVKRHRKYLPSPIRDLLYRQRVRLDLTPPKGLLIKAARTPEEFKAAFRLLHDAYVDAGYMEVQPSGMRLNNYQLVPGNRVLVAVQDGQVVATCSFVLDNPLGLPMDAVFDLDYLRKKGGGIAEVSALAIRRGYRGNPGRLLFPMMKYFYEYGYDHCGLRGAVFCVQPRHYEFYRAFFHTKVLKDGYRAEYGFVGGAPAQAGFLDFEGSLRWGKKSYRGAQPERNLYDYIVRERLDHIESPILGDDVPIPSQEFLQGTSRTLLER